MPRLTLPRPGQVVAWLRATASEAKLGLPEVLLLWASIVALVFGALWGLLFGVDALSSGSDPDCPPTGCYTAWTPPLVWLIGLGGAVVAFWMVGVLVRRRGAGVLLPATLGAAILQWAALIGAIFAGLVD